MVHGDCSSRGCYAMTDEQVSEIYALARESFFGGQRSFQVQAYPVPHDASEHGQAPQQSAYGVLEDAEGRLRPFRSHAAASRKSTSAKSAMCSTPISPKAPTAAELQPAARNARSTKCRARSRRRSLRSSRRTRPQIADTDPPRHAGSADQDGDRRRHASGLRGSAARRPRGEGHRTASRAPVPVTAPGTIPTDVNPPSNVSIAAGSGRDSRLPQRNAAVPRSRLAAALATALSRVRLRNLRPSAGTAAQADADRLRRSATSG